MSVKTGNALKKIREGVKKYPTFSDMSVKWGVSTPVRTFFAVKYVFFI